MWIVKNDAKVVEKAVHADSGSVAHDCNFIFRGKIDGHPVRIYTHPTNTSQSEVRIMSIQIEGGEE